MWLRAASGPVGLRLGTADRSVRAPGFISVQALPVAARDVDARQPDGAGCAALFFSAVTADRKPSRALRELSPSSRTRSEIEANASAPKLGSFCKNVESISLRVLRGGCAELHPCQHLAAHLCAPGASPTTPMQFRSRRSIYDCVPCYRQSVEPAMSPGGSTKN
jgi:hypothetical protein